MNYRRDNSKFGGYFFVLLAFLFVASEFFLTNFFWIRGVESFLVPIVGFTSSISRNFFENFSSFFSDFSNKSALVQENKKLKDEIDFLKSKIFIQEERLKEYDFVSTSVDGFIEKNILAEVVHGQNIPPYGSLIINKGKDDGVVVGDFVLGSNLFVIGKIEAVYKKYSRVKPFYVNGTTVDVYLKNSKLNVQMVGSGGGAFLILVPRDQQISTDDYAMLSLDSEYPIAKIVLVEDNSVDKFKKVFLTAPDSVKELRWVLIFRS